MVRIWFIGIAYCHYGLGSRRRFQHSLHLLAYANGGIWGGGGWVGWDVGG